MILINMLILERGQRGGSMVLLDTMALVLVVVMVVGMSDGWLVRGLVSWLTQGQGANLCGGLHPGLCGSGRGMVVMLVVVVSIGIDVVLVLSLLT